MAPLPAHLDPSSVPAHLRQTASANTALVGGLGTSYPVLSIRGKEWLYVFQGNEAPLVDEYGQPLRSINLVILNVLDAMSKVYFKDQYVPGQHPNPTCAAIDGIVPDPGVAEPQSLTCAQCPQNKWVPNAQGKQAKPCQDHKRLAVVPWPDIENATNGGPVLLRCPPGSFKNLRAYFQILEGFNVGYYGAITSVSFQQGIATPEIVFSLNNWIESPADLDRILAVRESPQTMSVIGADMVAARIRLAGGAPQPPQAPPQAPQAPVAPQPPQPPQPPSAPAAAPIPPATPTVDPVSAIRAAIAAAGARPNGSAQAPGAPPAPSFGLPGGGTPVMPVPPPAPPLTRPAPFGGGGLQGGFGQPAQTVIPPTAPAPTVAAPVKPSPFGGASPQAAMRDVTPPAPNGAAPSIEELQAMWHQLPEGSHERNLIAAMITGQPLATQ